MHRDVRLGVIIPALALAVLACTCNMAEIQSLFDSPSGPADGWASYDSTDMRLTVYYPEAWEIVSYGPENFDIEEIDGDGWLEIYLLTSETAEDLGLPYDTDIDGEEILASIMADARDMAFSAIETLQTQAGEASVVRAYDTEYDEYAYIAVVPLEGRALIGLGWGYERDTWEENYIPIYREIVQSINELEE